ncbi:MAG: CHAT domain-containing protein, partial [bacterium]|nr:CHAT domain-containing protein [bacterium]
ALVFADPPIPFGAPGDRQPAKGAERGGWTWAAPRLQPLPHARREGHAVVSHLGGESLLLVGKEASEDFLKHADLRRFGILHFATHSLVAEESPRNSAVLLAPGAEGEEGLLQIREIVELELDGRIVVLSSCRSASGAVLRGEGVMGLARAFFQAGAHTVVASLWPLRDRDAEKLFHRFYRYLGEGRSVAAALRAAQRDRIAAGAPAAAWAGLVVLGDGELVPVPGGTPSFRPTGWRLAFVGGVIFVLLLLGSLSLRRRGSPA